MAEDPRIAPRGGRPVLVVEESIAAGLPAEPQAAWPSAEAWCRAEALLKQDRGHELRGFTPPADWWELVAHLEEFGAGGGEARLLAWDLWCAASAWDHDRGSWWVSRASSGFHDREEECEWIRRAQEWGLRVMPASVEWSRCCAESVRGVVRLGLGDLTESVRRECAVLVHDRARGGSYASVEGLLRRARRRGLSWSALSALAAAGALLDLVPGTRTNLHERVLAWAGKLGPRPVRVPAWEWSKLAHGRGVPAAVSWSGASSSA